LNGAVLGFGSSSDRPFATNLDLSAGDRVSFSVGFGSNTSFLADTTGLDARLSLVPEPSGSVLFLSALRLSGLSATRRG
jgi:hypothetical protein